MTLESRPAIRLVRVRPPSLGLEVAGLLGFGLLVANAMVLAGAGARGEAGVQPVEALRPDQIAFASLGFREQASYQGLAVALPEIVWMREEEAAWPTPARLADESMAPFMPADGWSWRRQQWASFAGYLGSPPASEAGSHFYLEISQGMAASQDSSHRASPQALRNHLVLPGGEVYHFRIWMRRLDRPVGWPTNPATQGWQEVVVQEAPARGGAP